MALDAEGDGLDSEGEVGPSRLANESLSSEQAYAEGKM